jgi:hypothetical protein
MFKGLKTSIGSSMLVAHVCNIKFYNFSLESVTHTCIPSYSGSRDQEALGRKPPYAKHLQTTIWKNAIMKKRAGKVDQVVRDPA